MNLCHALPELPPWRGRDWSRSCAGHALGAPSSGQAARGPVGDPGNGKNYGLVKGTIYRKP